MVLGAVQKIRLDRERFFCMETCRIFFRSFWGGHIFRGLNENRGFLQVFAIIVAAQAVVVNAALLPGLGWLGRMFHCVPFSPAGWAVVIVLAGSVIPLDLIRKGILALLHPRAQEPEEKL